MRFSISNGCEGKSRIGSILSYLRSPVVEIERNGVTGFSKRYRVWKEGGGRYQSRCHHVRADFPSERVKRLFKWLVTDKEIESRDRVNVIVRIRLILVVRPRTVHFDWRWDKQRGTLQNVGNTYFKLLLKPGCDSTDEESPAFYLRPGETLRNSALRQKGQKYIVYNERFIRIDQDCSD